MARSRILQKLSEGPFDLLVVGGGITGAGIALDAATRGLSVALIERNDFASGTSSKSSKLVHGGLRYLEHREIGLMREAATERDLLRRVAPHLVTPVEFLWPRWAGANSKAGLGLWIYDVLAGFGGAGRHRRVAADEAGALAPFTRKPSEGYVYFDSQTDDVRLTLAVLQAAESAGAVVCNHISAEGFLEAMGSIAGCHVVDTLTGEPFDIIAGDTVNATGVWADELRTAESGGSDQRIQPSKGIHITIPRSKLPLQAALIMPAIERRLIFAIPWRSSVIVGTTDDEYGGPLDSASVTEDEVQYMVDSVNKNFDSQITANDVAGAYAGLRPLLSDPRWTETRDLSRRHAIFRGPKGLVTVTGGKLTTYRLMAEETVDLITRRRGSYPKCVTGSMRLGVTDIEPLRAALISTCHSLGLGPDVALSLTMSFGDRAVDVLELARHDLSLAEPVVDGLPYIKAEIVWAARMEQANTPEDLLARRTRIALEDRRAGVDARKFIQDTLVAAWGLEPETVKAGFDSYLQKTEAERGPAFRSSSEVHSGRSRK